MVGVVIGDVGFSASRPSSCCGFGDRIQCSTSGSWSCCARGCSTSRCRRSSTRPDSISASMSAGSTGLFAASFVLAVLLIENVALQAQLARHARNAAPAGGLRTKTSSAIASACSARSSNRRMTPSSPQSLDGIITGWNGAPNACSDIPRRKRSAGSIDIIVPRDRRAEVDEHPRRVARGEAIEHYETLRSHKDGGEVACFAQRLADQIADGRDRRRHQDRARHRRDAAERRGR